MKTKLNLPTLRRPGWLVGCLMVSAWVTLANFAAAGTWTALSTAAPDNVELMLLLSDGTVMAANAYTSGNNYGNAWYRLKPDSAGHYVGGAWTTRDTATYTRLWCSSQVLQDGRVFVAGGEYGTGGLTSEIYDPVADSWSTLTVPANLIYTGPSGDSANSGFRDSSSVMLPNGNVMIAPVFPFNSNRTVIYNPNANTWSQGPAYLSSQNEASWVKLADESILTIDKNSTQTERFIPSLNTWVRDGTMPVGIYGLGSELGAGFLLPDGRAFFIGGNSQTALYTPSPLGGTNAGTWVSGPLIPGSRAAPDAGACMMANGKILCAVGPLGTAADHFPTPVSFYEYDYTVGATGSFTQVNSPTGGLTDNIPSYRAIMLALPDGNVLYSHFGSQLYVYDPTGSPLAAGKPTITRIDQLGDGTFRLTGTKLNGISQGASYGDDAQMDSNYPLVRVTSGGGTVTYLRTYNWTSTSVMTGSDYLSVDFSAFGLSPGTYTLEVVANGNPSTGLTYYGPVWVDYNYSGFPLELGLYAFPWNTLVEGVSMVPVGGTINIKASSKKEIITITKAMTLRSVGGAAVVGK
jgi:hypothetical protein